MIPEHRRRPIVLLLDDEPKILKWLGRGLEAAGYDVVALADPNMAFARLRKMPVDLLILDIRLEGNRSGLEVLEFARFDETLARVWACSRVDRCS